MLAYIVRRILWMIPVILGIVLLTFFLFAIAAPDPAQAFAGKRRSDAELRAIRHRMGLDKPLWINVAAARESGHVADAFNSQFFDVLLFRFPESMHYEEPVWDLFKRKAPISFAIQLPIFIVLVGLELILAIQTARKRGMAFDWTTTSLAVATLSVPALSIYLVAQSTLGGHLKWFPVAGWASGIAAVHFAALPILVSIFGGWGGGRVFIARWYWRKWGRITCARRGQRGQASARFCSRT